MNDWMNEIETELGGLAPRSSGRDIVAAALCAHRESRILTAKRLRRELTTEELEAAFACLEEKYPDLISDDASTTSGMAIAFVQTPETLPAEPTVTPRRDPASQPRWLWKVTVTAALLACFAGGILIGTRANSPTSTEVTEATRPDDDPAALTGAPPDSDAAGDAGEQRLVMRPQKKNPARVTRRSRSGFRQRSSLPDLTRAYYRMRTDDSALAGL